MLGMMLNFAGAMSQAAGQRQAAEAKAAEYRYQAQIDENNRKVALWKAEDAKARGAKEEAALRVKVGQLKGRQRSLPYLLRIMLYPTGIGKKLLKR